MDAEPGQLKSGGRVTVWSLRTTSPVGYVEGWYVVPEQRRQRVGAALVAAEDWARACGCTERASDALIDNEGSRRAHARLGYIEVERSVVLRKML